MIELLASVETFGFMFFSINPGTCKELANFVLILLFAIVTMKRRSL